MSSNFYSIQLNLKNKKDTKYIKYKKPIFAFGIFNEKIFLSYLDWENHLKFKIGEKTNTKKFLKN